MVHPPAVSRPAAALAATLIVLAALAACGTQHAAPPGGVSDLMPAKPLPGGAAPSGSFTERARQLIARWDTSPAGRAWHTGLVLINAEDITPVPGNAGFNSQAQKAAFASGHFRLTGTLPATPLRGVVRWANGASQRVPLLSAKLAFTELATQQPCGAPYPCDQLPVLTVTSVRPATLTVATSRGPASIPAWQFTVAELSWPVREVAVAPTALTILPSHSDFAPTGQLAGVSAGGRTLTVRYPVGVCGGVPVLRGESYEGRDTVVIGVRVTTAPSHAAGPCPAMLGSRTVRIRLAHPLGTRVVLDVLSGWPML